MCQFKEVNFASESIKFNLFKSQTIAQTVSGVDTGSYVADLMLIYLSVWSFIKIRGDKWWNILMCSMQILEDLWE